MGTEQELVLTVTAKLPMSVTTLIKIQRALSLHWENAVVATDGADPSMLKIVLRGEPTGIDLKDLDEDFVDEESRGVELWYSIEQVKWPVTTGDWPEGEGVAEWIFETLTEEVESCEAFDNAQKTALIACLGRLKTGNTERGEMEKFLRRYFFWTDDPDLSRKG